MTNLENNKPIEDIHLNIGATFDFIDENLPEKYSREVLDLLPKDKQVDPAYIRIVKKYRIKNEAIINALYRVAQWNKLQKQQQ
ncbi:hypothetical protein [Chryseobacterium sp. MP_3.2]|uniref:hypothetical protein n=1 Tax=Chryseobacterium sp. MP_3.2 TaxID=3071712 RepID=UPI002E048725|nr:hypothetical protein [Chryseobacterium sp. MP_3.2]